LNGRFLIVLGSATALRGFSPSHFVLRHILAVLLRRQQLLKKFRVNRAEMQGTHTLHKSPSLLRAALPQNNASVVKLTNHGLDMINNVNEKISAAEKVIEQQKKLISTLIVDKNKITAGIAGEKIVSEFFMRALDKRWTVIEGFLGGKGEIDFILIGPLGVFAIEVKSHNGVVSCNGDEWTLTRPNGERLALKDNGGRSPSQQITETATWLENELRKVGHEVRIPKAIILAHPKARVESVANLNIDSLIMLGATEDFRKFLALGTPLSIDQITGIMLFLRY
jgi:hypothetical protein